VIGEVEGIGDCGHTMGKNCHAQATNSQFSRDGGSQFWMSAMAVQKKGVGIVIDLVRVHGRRVV